MIFKHKQGGFFFEAGAFDCDMNSVTFPIEFNNAWTGVLVEPMPDGYRYCKTVRRKAYLINTCLGTKEQPYFASFDMNGAQVHTSNTTGFKTTASFSNEYSREKTSVDLQCFPVYSILAAVGNPKVDLFVLDIEGYELAVLKTIPWNKVDIEVFDIEKAS
jgi:FkbM family methyltransferase